MEASKTKTEPLFSQEFFLCTFSLTMLLVSSAVGNLAILAFLAPWGLLALRQINKALRVIVGNWVLILIPTVATVSAVWSDDPMWSLKAGIELGVTVIAGILAAELIKPVVFVRSLITSLILIAFLSVIIGVRDGMLGIGGGPALQGIYDSKNAFSAVMALLMLVAITILADKKQPMIIRLAGIGAFFFTPVLLYLGQSVGAIVAVFATIAIFIFLRFLSRLGNTIRFLAFTVTAVILMVITATLVIAEINPLSVLEMVGKDPTLTGRTFLWEHAAKVISEQPFLGVGYRAFWRIGNHHAEQLWYESHVPIGSGFNFHNEYLEIMVELGIFGTFFMLLFFGALAKRVSDSALKNMPSEKGLACMLFILLILRTPLEVGIFDQFSIPIFLVAVAWIYLRPVKVTKPTIKNTFYSPTQPRTFLVQKAPTPPKQGRRI